MRFHDVTIVHLALALLIVAGLAAPVQAQGGADVSALRDLIARNGELLEQAAGLVHQTGSVKARTVLERARTLHQGSTSLFQNGRYLMAGRAAKAAREAILRTIAMAKQEAKLEEGAQRAIDRAANRIEQALRASDRAHAGADAPRKLIEQAQLQLQRAQSNLREHMYDVALDLASASFDLANRAIALQRGNLTPERVEREIRTTDDALGRARGDARGARVRFLAQATELQNRARRLLSQGRPAAALEQTQRARDLALRSMRGGGPVGVPPENAVAHALAMTDEVLEQARTLAREHGVDAAALDEAARVQRSARDKMAQGDLRAAMRLTRGARQAVRDALRGIEVAPDAANVETALRRTDERIAELSSALADHDDAVARSLLERAQRHQAQARTALESQRLREALALTKVAGTMVARGLQRLER